MPKIDTIELNGVEYPLGGGSGTGVSDELKTALLQLASKVAYIDDDGQEYYDDLYDALYPTEPPADLVSISAVYTQSGTVYDTDSLNSLKSDLVVTATYTDSSTETVPSADYTLSGTLTEGTSTITVSYGGKTTTFSVTVTHVQTSEVLSVISNSSNINAATFEDTSESNNWVFEAGTLNASTVNFTWDTEECDLFQIWIAQYDNAGTPYKISNKNVYATSPLIDGSQMNSWIRADNKNNYLWLQAKNLIINGYGGYNGDVTVGGKQLTFTKGILTAVANA